MIRQPFLRWTISTISRSSPTLTSLSFKGSPFSCTAWATLLPTLTLPTLQKLTVYSHHLPYPSLSLFLSRHNELKFLDIRKGKLIPGYTEYGTAPPSVKNPELPALEVLKATSDYLSRLEVSRLPKLVQITIGPSLPEDWRQSFRMEEFLNAATAGLEALLPLTASKKIKCSVMLLGQESEPWLQTPPQFLEKLRCIHTLHVGSYSNQTHTATTFPTLFTWLASFPALIEVHISAPYIHPDAIPELVSSFRQTCPKVEVLYIGTIKWVRGSLDHEWATVQPDPTWRDDDNW